MYAPVFGKNLRRITAELIISAIIVSFVEEMALIYGGFLKIGGVFDFILVTAILAVIEIVLVFLIEEFLIAAKHSVRRRIKRQGSLHKYTK